MFVFNLSPNGECQFKWPRHLLTSSNTEYGLQVCNLEFRHSIYNATYSRSSSSLIHHTDRPDILVYFAGIFYSLQKRIIAALCVSSSCYVPKRHVFGLRRAFVTAISTRVEQLALELVPGICIFLISFNRQKQKKKYHLIICSNGQRQPRKKANRHRPSWQRGAAYIVICTILTWKLCCDGIT